MFAQLRTGLVCFRDLIYAFSFTASSKRFRFLLLFCFLLLYFILFLAPEVLSVSVPQLKAHTLRFNQYWVRR